VVKYRPGIQNQPADAISRLNTVGHDQVAVDDEIIERFDFEACLRVSAFQFTRGSALYRE
jgi:hypothetical protein